MKTQDYLHRLCCIITILAITMTVSIARADYQSMVLNDHPIGYWSLDLSDPAAASGIATDLSGNGNDGSYFNIYQGYNNVPGPSAYITNGVSFDGSSTYVDLSTPATNTALLDFGGPITMEAWVQPANPTAGMDMDIIGKGDDVSQNYSEVEMRLDGSGEFHGGTYEQTAGDKGVTGGNQTTNWTYLVTAYDGTNWNLYVNGTLITTSADTIGAIDFIDPWAIGNGTINGTARLLAGNLSQVALYSHALTPRQVLAHYFVGLDGTTNVSPIIIQQPASQLVSPGTTVTFSYQAESLLPLTNQWYKNSIPLPDQTNATLVLTDVETNDTGNYSVAIGNSAGTTNSATATLTVDVQPTTIIWQTPQVISGASDVLTNGIYFASWAPGNGTANTLPVNGVTFQGYSDLPDLSQNFPGGGAGYNEFGSPGTADANYNALLQFGQYANGGGSSSFSWDGMTPGDTYEIQFWVEDARGFYVRWENLTGGSISNAVYNTGDDSPPVGYSSPLYSGAASPGYYIVGTFVANSAASEEILMTPFSAGGSADAQINLFQIRDISPASPAQPHITGINLSGTTLVINGTNGTVNLQFAVLTSTNVTLPFGQWTPISTNTFTSGNFSVTNTVNPSAPQNFYILQVQ
jgi:hypothetical protein